jgi:hypothetical protein
MYPMSLFIRLRRIVTAHKVSLASLSPRAEDADRLITQAHARFSAATSVTTDHSSWCWKCGERLGDQARATVTGGIHPRCT